MSTTVATLIKYAKQTGIDTCVEFSPELLVPEARIRDFCLENKCGNYGNNYMCPPYVGSLEEITDRFTMFRYGVLLQYSQLMDVENDEEGVKNAKITFHNKILRLEEFLRSERIEPVWGMIGGSCRLCEVCQAKIDKPCPFPDRARASLESLGVDVLALLDRLGLDSRFHHDRIIWTGCLLF